MQSKDVDVTQQRMYYQAALHQFMTLVVLVIIGVARWGAYIGDLQDERLKKVFDNRLKRLRTIINAIKQIDDWVIDKDNPFGLCMVARIEKGAQSLLEI